MPSRAINSQSTTAESTLLSIPLELRLHIFKLLLINPNNPIKIRSLFIRANYRNSFMSNHPCLIPTELLYVCKQITAEALPVLYSRPSFHCPCRVEQLSSQIGPTNFALIRHMSVNADDLCGIAASLTDGGHEGIRYPSLETLETDGYRAVALSASASRIHLLDALKLCRTAQEILRLHPILSVVGQDSVVWHGGADAIDQTLGRVKWRFAKSKAMLRTDEDSLDLEKMLDVLQDLLSQKESEGGQMQVLTDRGVYNQYPYLTV